MAVFCSLYSSSSGNCTYIGASSGGILVDVGVSAKRTEQALADIGVDPQSLRGIFITHEHTDHIGGVRVFASRYHLPVYATEGTLKGMDAAGVFNKCSFDAYVIPERGMEIAGMRVRGFSTPHDSNDPCGYTVITPDGKRIAIATDIGCITDTIAENVMGSDLVLLESNHDIGMLQNGSYPFPLKQRILSDVGHLNNEAAADFAVQLLENGTTRFVLGHLSKENNLPRLAYEATRSALTAAGAAEENDYLLSVAGDLNPPVVF